MSPESHASSTSVSQHEAAAARLDTVINFYLSLAAVKHADVKAHCERVGELAKRVAEQLQLDTRAAWVAGVMHDLGKLVLPYDLFDGHNISDVEYQAVKEHVQCGYLALKDQFLFTALVSGLHHAMSNGAGYGLSWSDFPAELSNATAKKILEISALVSICDFVDAFTHRTTKLRDGTGELETLLRDRFPNDLKMVQAVLAEL